MKAFVLALTASLLFFANSAHACRITAKGDSYRKVVALHETLADNEQLLGFTASGDEYEIIVSNYNSDQPQVRHFRLQNTSRMCPEYKAISLD